MDIKLLNGSALAYIGDCAYELKIRHHVINQGLTNPNMLHRASVKFVEARGQARIIQEWLHVSDFLSEEEISFYKRGRNHKANTKAKNASIGDYRQATGFEALMGWLYLSQQWERFEELVQDAIRIIEGDQANADK